MRAIDLTDARPALRTMPPYAIVAIGVILFTLVAGIVIAMQAWEASGY